MNESGQACQSVAGSHQELPLSSGVVVANAQFLAGKNY
jgi:hypothetical protein